MKAFSTVVESSLNNEIILTYFVSVIIIFSAFAERLLFNEKDGH
jgi:hypothetical protein